MKDIFNENFEFFKEIIVSRSHGLIVYNEEIAQNDTWHIATLIENTRDFDLREELKNILNSFEQPVPRFAMPVYQYSEGYSTVPDTIDDIYLFGGVCRTDGITCVFDINDETHYFQDKFISVPEKILFNLLLSKDNNKNKVKCDVIYKYLGRYNE